MATTRTALTFLMALGAGLGLATACSGEGDAPPEPSVTGGAAGAAGGGAGGTAGVGAGGSGGSLSSGGTLAFGGSGPVCTDPTDSDADGIADELEGEGDTDDDGTPDKNDDDSDADGILDKDEAGPNRNDPCAPVLNSGGSDKPDFQDNDADGDGLPDFQEPTGCADCRILADCDQDGAIDLVEVADGSDPCDPQSVPSDDILYFVVPYAEGPQSQRFAFSTGVKDADIYFLIDATNSMQAAIDNVKQSLDSTIIPTILNGDAAKGIQAVPGAQVGVGTVRDVPWFPWGSAADDLYSHRFCTGGGDPANDCSGGEWVYGNVSPPVDNGGTFAAPDNVRTVLNSINASGGGDFPEATLQAMLLAIDPLAAGCSPTLPEAPSFAPSVGQCAHFGEIALPGNYWQAAPPNCEPGLLGRACFRPGRLPIFVVITDAPFHNGPTPAENYSGISFFNGQQSGTAPAYAAAETALNAVNAKLVGVPVKTNDAGAGISARADMRDLAEKTGSKFFDINTGLEQPLVLEEPTSTGSVSDEVVRLIGLLAGQGLNNVTTVTNNYDCAGGVDCTGDGVIDPEYHNFEDSISMMPFDASQLIVSVKPVPVSTDPKPYASIDDTTFYRVRGDQTVEFEVTAENDLLRPMTPVVVRAILRVQTPTGAALGGSEGVKVIYLLIPPFRPPLR